MAHKFPRLLIPALVAVSLGAQENSAGALFASRVSPILKQRCMPCHDANTRSSGFSVASVKDVVTGGARLGPAVKPGDPDASPLVQVLRGKVAPAMPMGSKLSDAEIATIAEWVRVVDRASVAPPSKHWSYVPPVRPPAPKVGGGWVRNQIDAFVLDRLASKGLQPSPEADRRTLARRVYFDLLGLPPTSAELRQFLSDDSPDAYEKLIDRLLEDRRYGEKWARHWLDLARYADSNGYELDPAHPWSWRYRDYVIDAFNSDKPYDKFIVEQLAGDELKNPAKPLPSPDPEPTVALTFLRLAPLNRVATAKEQRASMLAEMTSTTASVFLGMTLGCARCHDHKYDAITHKDFFRMQAFFANVYIENTGKTQDIGLGEPAAFYRPGEKARMEALQVKYEAARRASEESLDVLVREIGESAAARLGRSRPLTRQELEKAIGEMERNAGLPKPALTADQVSRYQRAKSDLTVAELALLRTQPFAMAVRNAPGPPFGPDLPKTYVLQAGQWDQPGEQVEAGFPSGITDSREPAANVVVDKRGEWPSRGLRLTLARWIASRDNPLTARVLVNRVWQQHFGRGIVATTENLGRNGSPPSHPELLDWLAVEFMEKGWSVKTLHRSIMTSATYRQSSAQNGGHAENVDKDNVLLSRFPVRRLTAEEIRDSILLVSGRLDPEQGGPPVFPRLPKDLGAARIIFGVDTWADSDDSQGNRRSVYVFQRRALGLPFFEIFDSPVPNASCYVRASSTTPLQALSLYNGDFVNQQAKSLAAKIRSDGGRELKDQVKQVFRLVYLREPSAEELRESLAFADSLPPKSDRLEALARVFFNTNEFLYVD